jgi:hypothetical protein
MMWPEDEEAVIHSSIDIGPKAASNTEAAVLSMTSLQTSRAKLDARIT